MIQHAEAVNARLLKVFPKGFALGATHHPHISILQRYVHTADLDKVYDAVGKVLADKKAAGWSLKAFKYYYIVRAISFLVANPTSKGTPALAQRWGSSIQLCGKYSRPPTGAATKPSLTTSSTLT